MDGEEKEETVMDDNVTYMPNWILHDSTLPAGARLLYGVIVTRSLATGYCASTNNALGDSICVSPRRAQEFIADLIKRNLLTREIIVDPQTRITKERRLYPMKSELDKLAAWISASPELK